MTATATPRPDLLDPESGRRHQTLGEEIANSVSHGVGLIAAIAALPMLLQQAGQDGTRTLVGAAIFAATLVFLYMASTLYHALPQGRAKHVFRIIEHIAIYFLIAGTYTPFTLGVLRGAWGWSLFGVIWGLTLVGLLLKVFGGVRYPVVSTLLYLLMGWVVVVAIRPLWNRIPLEGFLWILSGGLCYTLGVVFYTLDHRYRYSHLIWHLFVMAGSTCHYIAVLWYAASTARR